MSNFSSELQKIANHLLELNVSFDTFGLWTKTDIFDAVNLLQSRMIERTAAVMVEQELPLAYGTSVFTLPTNVLRVTHAFFRSARTPVDIKLLSVSSVRELDSLRPKWRDEVDVLVPDTMHMDNLGFNQIEIIPAPLAPWIGAPAPKMVIFGVSQPATLIDGGADAMEIPKFANHWLVWGVIGRLLDKPGNARSEFGAQYGNSRFLTGITLLRRISEYYNIAKDFELLDLDVKETGAST